MGLRKNRVNILPTFLQIFIPNTEHLSILLSMVSPWESLPQNGLLCLVLWTNTQNMLAPLVESCRHGTFWNPRTTVLSNAHVTLRNEYVFYLMCGGETRRIGGIQFSMITRLVWCKVTRSAPMATVDLCGKLVIIKLIELIMR